MPHTEADSILEMLVTSDLSLLQIARAADMGLADLARLIDSPPVRATIDALRSLTTLREELVRLHHRPTALTSLARLSAAPDLPPAERRRALSQFLRALDAAPAPVPGSESRLRPAPRATPATPDPLDRATRAEPAAPSSSQPSDVEESNHPDAGSCLSVAVAQASRLCAPGHTETPPDAEPVPVCDPPEPLSRQEPLADPASHEAEDPTAVPGDFDLDLESALAQEERCEHDSALCLAGVE